MTVNTGSIPQVYHSLPFSRRNLTVFEKTIKLIVNTLIVDFYPLSLGMGGGGFPGFFWAFFMTSCKFSLRWSNGGLLRFSIVYCLRPLRGRWGRNRLGFWTVGGVSTFGLLPTLGLSEAGGCVTGFGFWTVGGVSTLGCYQRWASPRPAGCVTGFGFWTVGGLSTLGCYKR
jgi:hypothetical protein